jgi:hypothetical protein
MNKAFTDGSLPSIEGLKIILTTFDDDEDGAEEFGTADVLLQNLDKLNVLIMLN